MTPSFLLQEECQAFQIKGQSKQRIMFIEGGDMVKPELESLAVKPEPHMEEEGL
jgi:hypothetical protein